MVRWSQIESEYRRIPPLPKELWARDRVRERVVALYRKYEGQATDGIDRDTKVTVTSFARHAGLRKGTLSKWLRGPTACRNVPRREGFIRPMNKKLRAAIKAVPLVDEGTRQFIARDLAEMKVLINELEQVLRGEP